VKVEQTKTLLDCKVQRAGAAAAQSRICDSAASATSGSRAVCPTAHDPWRQTRMGAWRGVVMSRAANATYLNAAAHDQPA
jgi:hypothetical protein